MSNVVQFPNICRPIPVNKPKPSRKRLRCSADKVYDTARRFGMKEVVVLGRTADGKFLLHTNAVKESEILMMLARGHVEVMQENMRLEYEEDAD